MFCELQPVNKISIQLQVLMKPKTLWSHRLHSKTPKSQGNSLKTTPLLDPKAQTSGWWGCWAATGLCLEPVKASSVLWEQSGSWEPWPSFLWRWSVVALVGDRGDGILGSWCRILHSWCIEGFCPVGEQHEDCLIERCWWIMAVRREGVV